MRPFLKWAGNKYRLLQPIRDLLPDGKRLIKPFVGSGAVFLNTEYPEYLLADNNPDLINLYQQLQQEGEPFILACKRLFTVKSNQSDFYYRRRDEFNSCQEPRRKAVLFLYLNRHGYNGLCRYNASGGFNVPFGRYLRPYFPHDEMRYFAQKAQHARFVHREFTTVIQNARAGDVIYCDPPYAPLSRTANFTSYSSGGFDLDQQQQLASLAENARGRGVSVLISNHDTDFTRTTYQHANNLREFSVRRYISCNGKKRQHADELLALYC